MNVDRICSRSIVSAPRSCTLEQAAILMREHRVGALVVTDDSPNDCRALGIATDREMRAKGVPRLAVTRRDGALAGIVSFDDVVDALAAELASLAGVIRSEREREVVQRPEGLLVL